MKYTFEITISGCATNCGHCYVDGGPGAMMPFEDYVLCLQKLSPALDRLSGDICITLGNEMFCHPRLADIFRVTDQICPHFFQHIGEDIPTTGVALLRHRHREAILTELARKGTNQVCFAIHGDRVSHDKMVGRTGRFDQLFACADFLTDRGFQLNFSLMLSKVLVSGLDGVMARLDRYPGAQVFPSSRCTAPRPGCGRTSNTDWKSPSCWRCAAGWTLGVSVPKRCDGSARTSLSSLSGKVKRTLPQSTRQRPTGLFSM